MRRPSLPAVAAGCLVAALPVSLDAQESVGYRIEAAVQPAESLVRARAIIRIPSRLIGPDRTVRLALRVGSGSNAPMLDVTAWRLGDRWITPVPKPDTAGIVVVPLPERTATAPELGVTYTIRLDSVSRRQLGYYLYMATGPGRHWYPEVLGSDGRRERFMDFDVVLTIPGRYSVLTTGAEIERRAEAGGSRVRFHAEHVEGFALALGEGFLLQRIERGGIEVTAFSDSALAPTFQRIAERAADAAAWYRQQYGFFPVPRIGIIPGSARSGGGFPLPNVFMVHLGILDPTFLTWITAHELGHYYWGLYVLDDTERLGWLTLANGIWADQLYMAGVLGRTLEEQWRATGQGDLMLGYLTARVADYEQRLGLTGMEEEALDFDYNSLIRHGKAALGLYLQARLVGTDRFLEVQRRILREYRDRALPVADFVRLLEEAGGSGAGPFFQAWSRGDATIEYAVTDIRQVDAAGPHEYRITVARTGTVASPVDLEVRDSAGGRVRHRLDGSKNTDTLRVRLDAPLQGAVLDPDGVLPMGNSAHPDIRRLFVLALGRAGLTEPFLALAPSMLAARPDDEALRYELARRLSDLARYREVISLPAPPPPERCASRDACRTVLLVAQSYARLGDRARAEALLARVERSARDIGLERQWTQARATVVP
ncbi:MAG TPA: hypothetical protein VGA42_01580 [Gemmatimonadales bacterium]